MPTDKTPPATKTVGDLYAALDWSKVDRAAENTAKINPDLKLEPEDLKAFRLEKLHQAIWGTKQPGVQKAAQHWLHHFGLWEPIKQYLATHAEP